VQGIELRHISKRFGGVPALDDVSLTLGRGERLALIGENGAGKSSLMNVLYGLYQPDQGEVCFDGAPVRVRTPADALVRGVGMVHQHFTLVPTLTVTENVVLGHEPTRFGRLDLARATTEVAATCQRFGFQVNPSARVADLSVGSQQKVEIVKALHRGATTLILDEPTAVLTPQETDELFAVTRRLSEQGLTVVLISHKLRDVLRFATRIAVMRRGKKVGETTPAETSEAALAAMMIGTVTRAATTDAATSDATTPGERPAGRAVGPVRLELRGLTCDGLSDVSLAVHAGEILGVAGVDGNGQRELAEVLTGLRGWTKGELLRDGAPQARWTPARSRAAGVAHIPEDRLHRALIADLSVEENAALGRQRAAPFAKGWRIDVAGRRARTAALLEAHDVRPRDPALRAGGLSGGNQQKLVVGRELDLAPEVLVVVQPTRGLDLGAVAAVRARLREQRDRGCAVLLVSLDLDEVLELADRVVVLHAGKVTGAFEHAPFDERVIGKRMLGVMDA
jgi:simple sugar transport system ATP-binding protein